MSFRHAPENGAAALARCCLVGLGLLVAACGGESSVTSPGEDADAGWDVGSTCESDEDVCDDACVDLQEDLQHCGECGNECADGEVCDQGSCQVYCGGELTECDGVCRDINVDRKHCGECGNECADGEVCDEGECATSCRSGQTDCDGECRNLEVDNDHCGACGNACSTHKSCINGGCYAFDELPDAFEGLSLWLRSDEGVVSDGGSVERWYDQSGRGNNPIQSDDGARPTHANGVAGSHRAVRFDGSQHLVVEEPEGLDIEDEVTILMAIGPKKNGDDTQRYVLDKGDQAWAVAQAHGEDSGAADGVGLFKSGERWDVYSQAGMRTDTATVVSMRKEGDERGVRIEGEEHGRQATDQDFEDGGDLTIGAAGEGEEAGFEGDILEVLVYDRSLTDAEIEGLEVYLAEKYGLYLPEAPWVESESTPMRVAVHRDRLAQHQRDDAATNRLRLWYESESVNLNRSESPVTVSGWRDSSPNGFHSSQSTVRRQPVWNEEEFSSAGVVEFDGEDDMFQTPAVDVAAADGSSFSMAAWVRAESNGHILGKTHHAFGNDVSDENIYLRLMEEGEAAWRLEYNNSNDEDSLAGESDVADEWHSIVAVRDNWDFSIYVDGELDGEYERDDYYQSDGYREYNSALNPDYGLDFAVYRPEASNASFSEVDFGEVAVYDFALDEEEAGALHEYWREVFEASD
ncbi:MAG: MXAN_6577-like cysteine-rich protein [Persicimonas sp.]